MQGCATVAKVSPSTAPPNHNSLGIKVSKSIPQLLFLMY